MIGLQVFRGVHAEHDTPKLRVDQTVTVVDHESVPTIGMIAGHTVLGPLHFDLIVSQHEAKNYRGFSNEQGNVRFTIGVDEDAYDNTLIGTQFNPSAEQVHDSAAIHIH